MKDFLKRLAGSAFAFATFFALCFVLGKHHAQSIASPALFLLAAYGLTTLVVESKIAWPFSQLAGKLPVIGAGLYTENEGTPSGGLLNCPMCSGLWIGSILAALGASLYPIGDGLIGMRDLAFHGVISSGWSFAAHVFVEKLKK